MEPATTLRFAHAARLLADETRRLGLVTPGFRSPPRLAGLDRTLRWRPSGPTVAVRVRDRPWAAVLADLIEGVIVANRLVGPAAERVRAQLWATASPADAPSVAAPARVA
jgi:hypothetical protein